ncbi:DedA family protein (plasmid) [Embleya sp. NBC_00888]|uniref:DedA family protein n=1 Tax=Embleya sp. NBC_00888 TaxID=2975960 RepID=UPI002F9083FF|nr:DedA family protein [Embleya sp. NBC_00888]
MNALVDLLTQVSAVTAYALLAAAVWAESLLLVGVFVPTLTLLLSAGALARGGRLDLPLVIGVAAAAVVAGDASAHRTGRLLGGRLRTGRVGRRIPAAAWQRATALMDARGGPSILVCRFLPVIRTLAPHLAGATGLPYRRMAPYSVIAALVWAGLEAGTGYLAVTSIERLVAIGGTAMAALASTAVLALALWTLLRRRRTSARTRQPAAIPPTERGGCHGHVHTAQPR